MTGNSSETNQLLEQAAQENAQGLGTLLAQHGDRLRRMVALRLDQRLQGRIDPSDVIQEACLEASVRLTEYLRNLSMPFFLWLRFLTGQKLVTLHRHRLGVQMRGAGQEVELCRGPLSEASSAVLAAELRGHDTRRSEAAIRAELQIRVPDALNSLDPLDRELLALRHFEQLTVSETAAILDIKEKAAGMRYVRALRRLKEILTNLGGWAESSP